MDRNATEPASIFIGGGGALRHEHLGWCRQPGPKGGDGVERGHAEQPAPVDLGSCHCWQVL